jgi:hypothetical protein
VAKQVAPINVHDFRTPIPAPAAPRRPAPPIGDRLGTAVRNAIAELAMITSPDRASLRRVDDALLGALAWTAAIGDTCRIDAAATAVRAARGRLADADVAGATTALRSALDDLAHPR